MSMSRINTRFAQANPFSSLSFWSFRTINYSYEPMLRQYNLVNVKIVKFYG
jgi:hypothetical protein